MSQIGQENVIGYPLCDLGCFGVFWQDFPQFQTTLHHSSCVFQVTHHGRVSVKAVRDGGQRWRCLRGQCDRLRGGGAESQGEVSRLCQKERCPYTVSTGFECRVLLVLLLVSKSQPEGFESRERMEYKSTFCFFKQSFAPVKKNKLVT